MQNILCPSMMCADFSQLAKEIRTLDEAGTDIFHIDIMDGRFVPNFGMGLQDIKVIRQATKKLIDVHLMIMNPGENLEIFVELGADIIYIHPEADIHPSRTLRAIREMGRIPGLAINPGTSFESIAPLLNLVDNVMIMTVDPGFSGQKYLDFVDDKIHQFIENKEIYDYKLFVDGAISKEKVHELSELGVDGFVLGTSALFGKGLPFSEILASLRN